MRLSNSTARAIACALLATAAPFGCAVAPPDDIAAHGVAVAGMDAPIEFVEEPLPTDAAAVASATLTLADALRQALRNDPGIQSSVADIRAALADARQVRLLPNPVLSVAVRFPEGGGKTVIEAGLAADLVALLSRPRQISAADHRLRAASAAALTTTLDRIADVQDRYASVQAADAQIRVFDERQRVAERLLNLAKARLEAGESSRLDVTALEAGRVSLLVDRAQAESQRRDHRIVLARLLGQPSGRTDWELTPWSPPQSVTIEEVAWTRVAFGHRPEIQAQCRELAALGDEAAVAQLAAFDGADAGVDAERDGDWSIGPAVSTPLPLFDWGQQRRAKADAARAAARHRLTGTRRQVIEDVRRALESLTASQAALRQVDVELIPLSARRVEHAEAAYKVGAADVTSVLLAQQDMQAARSTQIELQQALSSALSRLQRAAGVPSIVITSPTTRETTELP